MTQPYITPRPKTPLPPTAPAHDMSADFLHAPQVVALADVLLDYDPLRSIGFMHPVFVGPQPTSNGVGYLVITDTVARTSVRLFRAEGNSWWVDDGCRYFLDTDDDGRSVLHELPDPGTHARFMRYARRRAAARYEHPCGNGEWTG